MVAVVACSLLVAVVAVLVVAVRIDAAGDER